MTRASKINYVTAILCIAFLFGCAYYYYQGFYLHQPFPFNTYLVNGLFGDFSGTVNQWRAAQFNGIGFGMSYFPATYLFVDLFARIPDVNRAAALFTGLFSIFAGVYSFLNLRTASTAASLRDAAICTFMAYPLLFEIVTGNLEGIVFVSLCLFVYAYSRGNYRLSAPFLAICISMKLFPAVFVILFIADKRYREAIYVLLYVVVLSIFPLAIFNGGISHGDTIGALSAYFGRLHQSQQMYTDLMIIGIAGNHFGHSLLNGLRTLAGPYFPPIRDVLRPYLIFSAIMFSLLSLFIIFVERTFWKRIAILTVCMCLLPYTSTDYKLLYFFIPLYLFINSNQSENGKWFDRVVVVLFSLLLISKSYIYFWNDPFDSLNVILNPAIMVAIVAVIVGAYARRHGLNIPVNVQRCKDLLAEARSRVPF